jgi:hypothetical protein
MRTLKVFLLCVLGAVALSGCSGGAADTSQAPKTDVGGDLGAAVRNSGGDYNKLSGANKQALLKAAGGSEAGAKQLFANMLMGQSMQNGGHAPGKPGGKPPGQ